MRPPAANNELFSILGACALIGAAIWYFQTPKQEPKKQVVVVQQKPAVVVKPARWEQEGVGPGWASGRGLGEGDFKHFGQMDHPFGNQPRYHVHSPQLGEFDSQTSLAGLREHPMHLPALPNAPRPPRNDSHGLGGYMMPPMGGSMGPVRY